MPLGLIIFIIKWDFDVVHDRPHSKDFSVIGIFFFSFFTKSITSVRVTPGDGNVECSQ